MAFNHCQPFYSRTMLAPDSRSTLDEAITAFVLDACPRTLTSVELIANRSKVAPEASSRLSQSSWPSSTCPTTDPNHKKAGRHQEAKKYRKGQRRRTGSSKLRPPYYHPSQVLRPRPFSTLPQNLCLTSCSQARIRTASDTAS